VDQGTVTFHANPAHLRTGLGNGGATTPITTPITTPNRILSLIRRNRGITQIELAQSLGLTRDGIKYHLNILKRDGVLRHVGPARGGHWEVLK
jgi:ATP-dependent DNA helicase RecG